MIGEAFFNNFTVENIEYNNESVLITLKSNKSEVTCTCCGSFSSKIHSNYERNILDLPMIDKYTKLKIRVRRFFCTNVNCKRKIFAESFNGFISRYKRLTDRLSSYVTQIALCQSANQSQRILKKFIPISTSSILRLANNYSISVNYDAELIGIDDFSFKKGISFGSIICDLKLESL